MTNQETLSDSVMVDSEEERPPRDLFVRLSALSREGKGVSRFYREALKEVGTTLGAEYAEILARLPAEVVEDYWHSGPGDPSFWRRPVRDLSDEAVAEARPAARVYRGSGATSSVALLAAPLEGGNGYMAAVVCVDGDGDVRDALAVLRGAVGFLTSTVGLMREVQAAERSNGSEVIEAVAKSAGASTRHELAFAITNGLRNRAGFEQVALGIVQNGHVKILSVSGFDGLRERNPGVRVIRESMEECLDRGQLIVCQRAGEWDKEVTSDGHRLHTKWHGIAEGAAVASVPLMVGDDVIAVLSIRGRAGQSLDDETINKVTGQVAPYAPALVLVERASRSLLGHAIANMKATASWAVRPGAIVKKVLLLALLLLVAWAAGGTMNYSISAQTRVTPAAVRHLVAPFEGIIIATHVRAGDRVVEGQILYELDDRDLQLQQDELHAEIAVAGIEVARALSLGDGVETELAKANRRALEARLSTVEMRLAQSVVRSPVNGTVIVGDLRKRTGQVVAQGDALFEIAPDGAWTIELDIRESDVDELTPAISGAFSCDARPNERQACTITRIQPQAEERGGQNIFAVEADLQGDTEWLRPGMEGVTRIEVGRRPVWWVLGHSFIDGIRRKLWL